MLNIAPMTDAFLNDILRVSVAQICQTIGYHTTQSSAIELLQHVLDKFMIEITRDLKRQAEHYNRNEVKLSDLELTLDSLSINLSGLFEYIENVDPEPFVIDLPFFPVSKTSNLNIPSLDAAELKLRHSCIYKYLPLLKPEEAPPLPPSSPPPPPAITNLLLPSNNQNGNVVNGVGENNIEANNTTSTTTASASVTVIKTELEKETEIAIKTEIPNAGESAPAATINNNDLVSQLATTTIDTATFESLFKPKATYQNDQQNFNNFCETKGVVMTNEGKIVPAKQGVCSKPFIPDFDNWCSKPLKDLKPSAAFNDGFAMPPPPPPQHAASTSTSLELPTSSSRSALMPLADNKDNKMDVPRNTTTVGVKPTGGSNKRKLRKEKSFKDVENSTMTLSKMHSEEAMTGHRYSPNSSPAKKAALMPNASGVHSHGQNSFATMLLKRAKKQKMPTQGHSMAYDEKDHQLTNTSADKYAGKLNAIEKIERKCVKMLQKLVKQAKLPFDIVNAMITVDKKLKDNLNPAILLTGIAACPEKQQLDKLLRKRAKQRQKLAKQQLLQELNKRASDEAPPKDVTNPLAMRNDDVSKENISDKTDAGNHPANDSLAVNEVGMDANELDRNKLNVFKKLTKAKNAKSPSGLSESNVIKIPSGTTITPAPTPVTVPTAASDSSASITSPQTITQLNNTNNNNNNINVNNNNNNNLNHNINASVNNNNLATALYNNNHNNNSFLVNNGSNYAAAAVSLQSDDTMHKNALSTTAGGVTHPIHHDLSASYSGRVFGEKTADAVDITHTPKKRGRKPGSKNHPKLAAADLALTPTSKKTKKTKYENNLFPPANLHTSPVMPPAATIINTNHHSSFTNSTNPFELNNAVRPAGILPMFAMPAEHPLQQQITMANAKERKERKKNKIPKTAANMNYMNNNNNNNNNKKLTACSLASPFNLHNNLGGSSADASANIPTSEEVQSINKKLMRMDTTLKPAPMQANDLHSAEANPKFQTINATNNNKLAFSNAATLNNSTAALKSPRSLNDSINHNPFIIPNQQFSSQLPGNMLSMLPFPFPPRPGLIPTAGLFPNPNLAAFAVGNMTKNNTTTNPNTNTNMLLPGLFPFPLKQSQLDNNSGKISVPDASAVDSEDLTMEHRKTPANERNYCNVAPLVPEFLKLSNAEMRGEPYGYNNDLPRTPKARTSQLPSNCNTPDSQNNQNSFSSNSSGKSIPTTPGAGISLSSYEQLLKKHDSPIEVIPLGAKYPAAKQENALRSNPMPTDFTAYARSPSLMENRNARLPINADETIEVSDDSDEMNQNSNCNAMTHLPAGGIHPSSRLQPPAFARDNISKAMPPNFKLISFETELTTKELKKLKKQVKKASASAASSAAPAFCTNLLSVDKNADGVGKLAGGADLIPLSSTGLAYSSQSIPFNSLTGGNSNPTFGSHTKDLLTSANSMVFDNITITPAISLSSSDGNCLMSSSVHDLEGQKRRKEHKKLKKLKELKEGKIKKKKDKKDKMKNKDKAEKYLSNQSAVGGATVMPCLPLQLLPPSTASLLPTTSKDNHQRQVIEALPAASGKTKDKDPSRKKEKKEKKKDKQRPSQEETSASPLSIPTAASSAMAMASYKDSMAMSAVTAGELKKSKPANVTNSMLTNSIGHQSLVPGLHSPSSQQVASAVPKLTLKLSNTHSPSQSDEVSTSMLASPTVGLAHSAKPSPVRTLREPSPELARISPLVTRPPKHKLNTSNDLASSGNSTGNALNSSGSANSSLDLFGDSHKNSSGANVNLVVPPPSPWLSGGTISASSVLLPNQLLQSTKTHDLTTGATAGSRTGGHGADTSRQNTSSSERKSPLTTLIAESSRPSSYIDAEGNRVWICPACGKVDDGSPMIGCDGCDAWYHWICVGIVVAPKDNEDWFCRVCITRRKGIQGTEKKRKRTKKK